jgi:tetratricopeptide (TPR) repeat protein
VLASLETGQYISLEDLAFKKTYLFRRQKYQRIIALQQAGSFVKYLIEKYGLNTFRQIYISRVQKFEKYYNKSLAQLEDEWLMDLKNKRLSNKQKAREKLAEVFIYNWLDMPDESLTACKEAVSIAPDDDMACAYLALAHYYHKNYMMSIDYARLSLENNPDNIGALVALAASHLRVGNLNEAENIATEALNNIYMACCHWGFYTVFAKCILGEVCLKNNNTKQGVKYYEEAIALSDEDLKVKTYQGFHYNLGLAYKKQGKLDKAEDEFKKVIESSQVAEKVITASPARGPQNQFADKAREELKKF